MIDMVSILKTAVQSGSSAYGHGRLATHTPPLIGCRKCTKRSTPKQATHPRIERLNETDTPSIVCVRCIWILFMAVSFLVVVFGRMAILDGLDCLIDVASAVEMQLRGVVV